MNRSNFAVLIITMGFSVAAQAANWPVPAAACLPSRATAWDNSKAETAQASCHCPPTSLCPRTAEEYNTPRLQKMPTAFIFGLNGNPQCCPDAPACPDGTRMPSSGVCPSIDCTHEHEGHGDGGTGTGGYSSGTAGGHGTHSSSCPQVCPANTNMAGQPMPSDGICNRCQEGTRLAGQVSDFGNCTPTDCSENLSGDCVTHVCSNPHWTDRTALYSSTSQPLVLTDTQRSLKNNSDYVAAGASGPNGQALTSLGWWTSVGQSSYYRGGEQVVVGANGHISTSTVAVPPPVSACNGSGIEYWGAYTTFSNGGVSMGGGYEYAGICNCD